MGLIWPKSLNTLIIQLTLPSAFDEAGIRMLDSIREIFDILDIEFESIGFKLIEYKTFEELSDAFDNGKYPIIDVLQKYLYSEDINGSHAMVATGIKNENGVECIQLKNSYADDPTKQGNVQSFLTFRTFESHGCSGLF